MTMQALLDRVCDIWGVVPANPEVENSVETEGAVISNVSCRIDSILHRRLMAEVPSPGGMRGVKRATIFVQDDRLIYPTTFNEDNWIVQAGIRWDIQTIHDADDGTGLHHYEVDCQAGRDR